MLARRRSGPGPASSKPGAGPGGLPVATYSIVARAAETGQLGVAVQSHYFSVGSVSPHADAGVAAVTIQSFAKPSYGTEGLRLIREGASAHEALGVGA